MSYQPGGIWAAAETKTWGEEASESEFEQDGRERIAWKSELQPEDACNLDLSLASFARAQS